MCGHCIGVARPLVVVAASRGRRIGAGQFADPPAAVRQCSSDCPAAIPSGLRLIGTKRGAGCRSAVHEAAAVPAGLSRCGEGGMCIRRDQDYRAVCAAESRCRRAGRGHSPTLLDPPAGVGWDSSIQSVTSFRYALQDSTIARRRSRRSVRAQAASALLRMVCQGGFGRFARLSGAAAPVTEARAESRRWVADGKTWSRSSSACVSTAPARVVTGTRCSLGDFSMRGCDPESRIRIDFVRDHVPDLARAAAVGTRNSKAGLVDGRALEARTVATRERRGRGVGCGVVGAMPAGDGRFHDRGDALACATRGLPFGVPCCALVDAHGFEPGGARSPRPRVDEGRAQAIEIDGGTP